MKIIILLALLSVSFSSIASDVIRPSGKYNKYHSSSIIKPNWFQSHCRVNNIREYTYIPPVVALLNISKFIERRKVACIK